jgi:methyl-accepting chemotaxis protein
MRRFIFLVLGGLELLSAVVLAYFAWLVPSRREVEETAARAERVTRHSGEQVQRLRDQFRLLHERRPQMQALALRLQTEMRVVNDHLKTQQIDYDTVKTLRDALGDAANGLDGLPQTLDPKGLKQFGEGMKAAADFLENQVGPTAAKAADDLDQTTDSLREDAKRLSSLLRTAPLDLKAARAIHDSLRNFDQGLERMHELLKIERINTMREGFKGLEQSLNTGAEQVQRLSSYTYPVVRFNGWNPSVEQRAFWPQGSQIADGMRMAAKGATAANEELQQLAKDLPKLRQALQESRKAAGTTREALATALQQQDKVEGLLKNVPEYAARLTEQLPQLADSLAKILRDTSRLKEVGKLLRQTQTGIDSAVARWPQLRKNLAQSSTLLRNTRNQLDYVLTHRDEYEASLQHTLLLSRTISAALPLLAEQLEMELDDQERALTSLDDSINDVHDVLPRLARGASNILQTTRLLLLLLAAIFGLHGGYLIAGARMPDRAILRAQTREQD